MKENINYLEQKINTHIPNDVIHKIQKMCSIISEVEWAGILLYTMKGSLQKPKSLRIDIKDFIPMNKGSKTHTSFNYTEEKRDVSQNEDRHIDYINENEEAMLWRIGLIHSHNSMQTYFSSVDNEELYEGAKAYNNFLSLIVNNNMDFECQLSFLAKAEVNTSIDFLAKDEKGKKYKVTKKSFTANQEQLFVYKCNLIHNLDKIKNRNDNLFDRALSSILAASDNTGYKVATGNTPKFPTLKNNVKNFRPLLNNPYGNTGIFEDFEEDLFLQHSEQDLGEYLYDESPTVKFQLSLYPKEYQELFIDTAENEDLIVNLREALETISTDISNSNNQNLYINFVIKQLNIQTLTINEKKEIKDYLSMFKDSKYSLLISKFLKLF